MHKQLMLVAVLGLAMTSTAFAGNETATPITPNAPAPMPNMEVAQVVCHTYNDANQWFWGATPGIAMNICRANTIPSLRCYHDGCY